VEDEANIFILTNEVSVKHILLIVSGFASDGSNQSIFINQLKFSHIVRSIPCSGGSVQVDSTLGGNLYVNFESEMSVAPNAAVMFQNMNVTDGQLFQSAGIISEGTGIKIHINYNGFPDGLYKLVSVSGVGTAGGIEWGGSDSGGSVPEFLTERIPFVMYDDVVYMTHTVLSVRLEFDTVMEISELAVMTLTHEDDNAVQVIATTALLEDQITISFDRRGAGAFRSVSGNYIVTDVSGITRQSDGAPWDGKQANGESISMAISKFPYIESYDETVIVNGHNQFVVNCQFLTRR